MVQVKVEIFFGFPNSTYFSFEAPWSARLYRILFESPNNVSIDTWSIKSIAELLQYSISGWNSPIHIVLMYYFIFILWTVCFLLHCFFWKIWFLVSYYLQNVLPLFFLFWIHPIISLVSSWMPTLYPFVAKSFIDRSYMFSQPLSM